jgi:hypothetical protein
VTSEATRNPHALSLAVLAYGFAWRNADPERAVEAMHRSLAIAHDSGNRFNESHIAATLAQLEMERERSVVGARPHQSGDPPLARFRQHRHSPFAFHELAILLDRLEHYEPAATIAGFALSPLTAASFPTST